MRDLKIACVGDIMCGDHFSKTGWGSAAKLKKYGKDFLPPEIQSLFRAHDLVIGNIESVLSDVGRNEKKLRSLHMRGSPESACYIAHWGINVAHLANNHILEQGVEAARDTADNLLKSGVKVIGAGRENKFSNGISATRIDIDAFKISLIGACFHTGKYSFCPGGIDELLAEVIKENAENRIIIVSLHWGEELIDYPSLWQRELSTRLREAGATLIVGHHPHVFQAVEQHEKSLTAYSLGNFIFDSEFDLTRWTAVLSVSIGNRIVKKCELIPIIRGRDCRPEIAWGQDCDELNKEIKRRNDLLRIDSNDVNEFNNEYLKEVKLLDDIFRKDLHRYIRRNWFQYKRPYRVQMLLRPVKRRLGIY